MNCFNSSHRGASVASINILIYIILSIYLSLLEMEKPKAIGRSLEEIIELKTKVSVVLLIFCAVMAILSCLLLTGIVKQMHNLMLPWLILSGFGFLIYTGRYFYGLIFYLIYGVSGHPLLFLSGFMGVSISATMLIIIFDEYRAIRKQNITPTDLEEVEELEEE